MNASPLFISIRAQAWILILAALGLLSCSIVPVNGSAAAAGSPGIIFVTVTPPPEPIIETLGAQPLPEVTPIPYFDGANELGKVLVLEYHRLGFPEQRFLRTPANFRADLARLYESGYYPVNFIDLIRGLRNVPAGKKPIVLTFDDSDISQFRVLPDRTVDADSAVGIILNFHNQHPDWPTRATFFVLGNDTANYISLFGQPDWAKAKIQFLVQQGMEVGSHTVSHVGLGNLSAERIAWELAISQYVIEDLAPGYQVESLSVPYGEFPYTNDFLKAGQWRDYSYTYSGNAAAWGGPGVSPFDPAFDPYHVSRLEVTATSFDQWLTHFEQNPQAYYVSDGDANRLTAPQ